MTDAVLGAVALASAAQQVGDGLEEREVARVEGLPAHDGDRAVGAERAGHGYGEPPGAGSDGHR